MKPLEVIDLLGAYLVGFIEEEKLKDEEPIIKILNKINFKKDDGSDFFDQELLDQLFSMVDYDIENHSSPMACYLTVTTFLKLYFKKYPDKQAQQILDELIKKDKDNKLSLFHEVLFNYYSSLYYSLATWFMFEIGGKFGLTNKDLSRWDDSNVNGFNKFVDLLTETEGLDYNGYYFLCSYLDELPDPFSNKIMERVPYELWRGILNFRSLFFPRVPPYSLTFVGNEKRVDFDFPKNQNFSTFLLFLALGRKGHFSNEVEHFMIQSPSLDSPFSLYKDGKILVEEKDMSKLLIYQLNGQDLLDSILYGKDVYVEEKKDEK